MTMVEIIILVVGALVLLPVWFSSVPDDESGPYYYNPGTTVGTKQESDRFGNRPGDRGYDPYTR